MDLKITNLDGGEAGSVEVSDAIFGLKPRQDILQRCVVWQLSRRQAGTHKVKARSEIARTGKKIYRQKGTGGARHGSARANLFRGGGRSHGPVVRSHAIDLPKKVRALALRHALSAKAKDGGIVVIENAKFNGGKDGLKTKGLKEQFGKLGFANVLIIDGAEVAVDFQRAARNLPHVDVLPVQGINVYDIMRRQKLVLTRAAIDAIEARFAEKNENDYGRLARAAKAAGSVASAAGKRVRKAAAAVGSTASAAGSAIGSTAAATASAAASTAASAASAAASKAAEVGSGVAGSVGEAVTGAVRKVTRSNDGKEN
jgi:large subunit ribosomal protein L4